jgi:purine nucleosidase/pyrimidine-specific ribonucleoside hydrolase
MKALVAAALCCAAVAAGQLRVPVIIDTDLGDAVDDAFALSFALNSPEFDIRAVTTVIDDVESKTRLAWKFLGQFNRRDIPLAMGASEPLLAPRDSTSSRQYQVLTPNDIIPETARRPAAEVIVETIRKSPSKVTIVAIGPLTNIALALKLDPSIRNNIERIALMGGAYFSNEIEYNIRRDPAAAEIVFRSGVPVTALGLEVTQSLKLRDSDLEKLRIASDPAGIFLLRLLELSGEEHPTLYDPLALAVILKPELVEMREGGVQVSLEDGKTSFAPAGRSKTVVGSKVYTEAALDLIISRLVRSR